VDKAALVKRIDLHDVDLGNVADGVYEGSFTVSYPAAAANKSARVRVTVAGGRYERIELLQPPLSGTWADTLLDRVREKQSLSSDAISSGTITAAAILRAIQTAVESAPAAPGR
jgi:uncharacterized protein with FMN-binding domain